MFLYREKSLSSGSVCGYGEARVVLCSEFWRRQSFVLYARSGVSYPARNTRRGANVAPALDEEVLHRCLVCLYATSRSQRSCACIAR